MEVKVYATYTCIKVGHSHRVLEIEENVQTCVLSVFPIERVNIWTMLHNVNQKKHEQEREEAAKKKRELEGNFVMKYKRFVWKVFATATTAAKHDFGMKYLFKSAYDVYKY